MQLFGPAAVWNQPCDQSPIHPKHGEWMQSGHSYANTEYPTYCLPYDEYDKPYLMGLPRIYVHGDSIPLATVGFHTDQEAYPGESDDPSGGIPIPDDVVIEQDPLPYDKFSDRHCSIVDLDRNILHEFWRLKRVGPQSYLCGTYARWDLSSYAMRQDEWTSADAAGLPIAPLLIGYDELVEATANNTEIPHALRFTLKFTKLRGPHIWPARHSTTSGAPTSPPMGMRVRLRQDFDETGLWPHERTIVRTLKKYGMYVADNGIRWEICFTYDARWKDYPLFPNISSTERSKLFGRDFEAVDDTYRQVSPDSAEVLTNKEPDPMDEIKAEIEQATLLIADIAAKVADLKTRADAGDQIKSAFANLADAIKAVAEKLK